MTGARWEPRTERDLAEMIASGALQEGHHFDAKREIGENKAANKELAKDIASFAVDGGLLAIGIAEDKATGEFALAPGPVSGVPERIEQIARSLTQPPLDVRTTVIGSAASGTHGYLIVEIPVSPLAPHMVDGRYWGRNDRTKHQLSDAEVERLLDRRRRWASSADDLLTAEIERDPVPDGSLPHLFVVAQPVAADADALLPLIEADDRESRFLQLRYRSMTEAIRSGAVAIAKRRGGDGGWDPDFPSATTFTPRPDGVALTVYDLRHGRVYDPPPGVTSEYSVIDLEFREDAGLRLFCGRAGDYVDRGRRPDPPLVILDVLVVGLVRRMITLAAAVGSEIDYRGPWDFGVAVTGLTRTRSYERLDRSHFADGVPLYAADSYRETRRSSTDQLNDRPGALAGQLVGRLLRGLNSHELLKPLTSDPEPATSS